MFFLQVKSDVYRDSRMDHGDVSLVTWRLNNEGMSSEEALKSVEQWYYEEDVHSKIIEQTTHGLDHHAIVQVDSTETTVSFVFVVFVVVVVVVFVVVVFNFLSSYII